jgi:hypothetical protein
MRRLYHVEAGFYAYKLKILSDTGDRLKLDDFARLGMVADCNNGTLTTLNRQEARLERSFYKALQELQRIRTQRPTKVEKQTQKSTPPAAPPTQNPHPVGQVPDLPSPTIIDNPTAAPAPPPTS